MNVQDKNSSFDRLFPNQDYHSGKELGTLIALPLQKKAWENQNTCFINPSTGEAFNDQWEFLCNMQRVSTIHLDELYKQIIDKRSNNINEASNIKNQPINKLHILLDNHIFLSKNGLPNLMLRYLRDNLNFINTEYLIKKSTGKNTFSTEKYFDQWIERIQSFLGIPAFRVGKTEGGNCYIGEEVTVAMIQSLQSDKLSAKLYQSFGTILVDECHHIPAKTFRQVIGNFHSFYLYGFTATPMRKNKDEKLIFIYIGDIIHEVIIPVNQQGNRELSIVIQNTELFVPFNASTDKADTMLHVLIHDTARNELITNDIKREINAGRKILVLTERIGHIKILYQYLKGICEVITLTGEDREEKRKAKFNLEVFHFRSSLRKSTRKFYLKFRIRIDSINNHMIDSVRFEFVKREIFKGEGRLGDDKPIHTMEDLLSSFDEERKQFSSEGNLIDDILNIKNSRHYFQLKYLSSRHEASVLKLRFVLQPFSFLFLLGGERKYHIIWETLDSEEATYIWHADKTRESLRITLSEIENILSDIKQTGRQTFLEKELNNFSRVVHDYSDAKKGFVAWKGSLEEKLI